MVYLIFYYRYFRSKTLGVNLVRIAHSPAEKDGIRHVALSILLIVENNLPSVVVLIADSADIRHSLPPKSKSAATGKVVLGGRPLKGAWPHSAGGR